MKKKIIKISTFILLCIAIISCARDRPPKKVNALEKDSIVEVENVNEINFYFENSGSINGYLNGDNFQQTIRRVLLNLPQENLSTYFVNTKEYVQTDIKSKIENKKIKSTGTGSSDHKFIFKNAINKAKGNNLSIVITDGIYSVKDGNIALVEIDIEDAFKKALKENELETIVLKMTSNFKGRYYSESCKKKGGTQINQSRPYYIFLFGNNKIINNALKEIVVVDDLEGFKEQARFLVSKELKLNYTALTKGEEKAGSFREKKYTKSYDIKEIEDVEKYSKRGLSLADRYLQFGIAVDYSNLSIPENYLINPSNYSIADNTNYTVEEIKNVKDLPKDSKTYKWIENLNKKEDVNFTNVIVVKSKTKLFGDLKINLDMNFPSWIQETGSKVDCEIKGVTNTTFAFDRLINGISKAYQKVSKKETFFELKINIKP